MRRVDRRTVALIGGGYAVVGAGLAAVGFAGGDWARAQFLAAADGAVAEFGPTYLALAAYAAAVAGLLAVVGVGGVLGALAGGGHVDPKRAGVVGGASGLAGALAATAALLLGIAGGAGGEGGGQVFSLGQAAVPGAVTVVAAGGVVAGTAAVGARAGE
ncbi:hypothetical protein BRC97_01435 [Halobacteriales archaeon QS_6_71_20]|nr:MAG: hypothetical protein BRC97_01435 [Halobacteriales archaeon QS_6_71_20]